MSHKIKSIKTKDGLILEAVFLDGTVREYDVANMFALYPLMEKLEDRSCFDRARIDVGGYGISWDDELDLDAETIWEEGKCVGKEKMDLMSELASKLSDARANVGLTQKQLSERTGIYQADISKIERGTGNPSISTLQRLADGMGMELVIEFQRGDRNSQERVD